MMACLSGRFADKDFIRQRPLLSQGPLEHVQTESSGAPGKAAGPGIDGGLVSPAAILVLFGSASAVT